MPKYLFTSDQRISVLPERIKWVAEFVKSGHNVSEIEDKSDNNNATTLKFYYNLYSGTETCERSATNPLYAIRNFVLKFQFPNVRTQESLQNALSERLFLAPFRSVASLLEALSSIDDSTESTISMSEILYFVFCNPKVYTNPSVNYGKIALEIMDSRNKGLDYEDAVSKVLEWNQYGRQARELITVITFASKCFTLSKGILKFCKSHADYESDKEFIKELLTYNKFWYPSNVKDFNLSTLEYISYMNTVNTPYSIIEFSPNSDDELKETKKNIERLYRPYITAIKSKPFLLLAGISGTGKSRIVRELARACWDENSEEYKAQKPKNFQMVQVKPNWHDSSDLIGYVSRVSGKAEFVAGEFLKFVAKAWEDVETPYFLCLDEMNLAPVEQYFAEYLSVIESRKSHKDGTVTTDPIVEKADEEWYFNLTASLTSDEDIRKQFNEQGICIPQNLIVVGTVNMDETTFSFSRKVLDRAMTIEMNEVDLHGGLTEHNEQIGKLGKAELIGSAVEGVDVYKGYTDVCETALGYLQKVNDVLEGTPFKLAYRTRNEFLLYVVNNLPYCKDDDDQELPQEYVIARALDEITCMKVLSRIEGDDTKVSDELLDNLSKAIEDGLKTVSGEENRVESISLAKIKEMKAKLVSGYTSFWS